MRLSLIRWPGSGGSGSGTLTNAINGTSLFNSNTVQLGQNVGQVGSPASLLSIREIPLEGFSVSFLTSTGDNLYVGEEGYNSSPSWHSSGLFTLLADENFLIYKGVGNTFESFPVFQLNNNDGLISTRYSGVVEGYAATFRGDLLITTSSAAGQGQGQGGDIYLRPSTNYSGTGDPTLVTQYENGSIILQPSYAGIVLIENSYAATLVKIGTGATGTDTLQVYGTQKLNVLPTTINAVTPVGWDNVTHQLVVGTGTVITADNGLTKSTLANVQLGGTLLHSTIVDGGQFLMSFSGAHATNQVVSIFNTAAGIGAKIEGTSGTGAQISSLTGTALEAFITPASTNVSTRVANFYRSTSGTPANNMGGQLNFQLRDTAPAAQDANRLEWIWTNATSATRTSEFSIWGVTSGAALVKQLSVSGDGAVSFGTAFGFTAQSGTGGIYASGSITGVYAQASGSGIPLFVNHTSTSPNTVIRVAEFSRQGVYNAGVGVGTQLGFNLHNAIGAVIVTGNINHVMTDVTLSAEVTEYQFNLLNGGGTVVNIFKIKGKQSTINIPAMPVYANNAAAISGGLDSGDLYRNGDLVQIVH